MPEDMDYTNRVQYDLDSLIQLANNRVEMYYIQLERLQADDAGENLEWAVSGNLDDIRNDHSKIWVEIMKRLTTNNDGKELSIEERMTRIEYRLFVAPFLGALSLPDE